MSGGYYARNEGKNWIQTMLVTACLFPLSCFSIAFVLNTIAIFYQVGGAAVGVGAARMELAFVWAGRVGGWLAGWCALRKPWGSHVAELRGLQLSRTTNCPPAVPLLPVAVEFLEAGLQTTVQDYPGRVALWSVGVPPSGPMDDLSHRWGGLGDS